AGGVSLVFAIADHPWVDSAGDAAVRISMTVGAAGSGAGELLTVVRETPAGDGSAQVSFKVARGVVHSDLRIGANTAAARPLQANADLSNRGFCLFGAGFIVTSEKAAALGLGSVPGLDEHVLDYRNGRDLMDKPRRSKVIDLYGLTPEQVRQRFPAVYQHVVERVKPERDANKRKSRRDNWWIFGEPNTKLRLQLGGLRRYVATVETSKHRVFQFLDAGIAPDNKLIAIAVPDAAMLGVLSSRVHVQWALASGSKLEDRPVYVKTKCFEAFPFPDLEFQPALAAQIAALAEELDAHRKRQQAAHDKTLTLTDMYNVLDALRLGRTLTAKERVTHADGLVSVLAELHDRLDALVLQAYGWADLVPALVGKPGGTLPWPEKPAAQAEAEEELLTRLVALNAERAAEEARGLVRWLRPDFQDPARRAAGAAPLPTPTQDEIKIDAGSVLPAKQTLAAVAPARRPWPATLPEQMRGVADLLSAAARPIDAEAITAAFTGRGPWKRRVPQILDALAALGRARQVNGQWAAG
ncbi:MAG: type IIL restriction-modification enzyme MmeI, partial [Burkholderiales bacterium]